MTRERSVEVSDLKILWVSHGFGYRGDLMYYGEIFRAFRDLAPKMAVVVDSATQFINDYALLLLPMMRMFRRKLRRTAPDGQVYDTEIVFPSPSLVKRIVGWKPDVLITIEFTPAALMATLAAAVSGRGLVLLVESDPTARGGSRNAVVRRMKQWIVSRAHVIQTNNDKGRRYLVQDLRADPGKVRVAPYLTSRPPGPESEVTDHDGPLRILFANSINQRKGLRQLIEALRLLPAHLRDQIALTVVGDGPERAELEESAQDLGMGQRLRFLGARRYSELGPFYAEADVLAIPSLADYRSLSGFEGLGYGLALLASSKDGATEETVREGVNGFCIDPFASEEWAQRIATLVSDRALVLNMRHASGVLYKERFSLEAIADNVAASVSHAVGR